MIILNVFLGLGVIALAVWMIVMWEQQGKFLGAQYVEVRNTVEVYDPRELAWYRTPDPDDPEETIGYWVERAALPADPEAGDIGDVDDVVVEPADLDRFTPVRTWEIQRGVSRHRAGEEGVVVSLSRTIGLWFAAICTLFVFSFLYRDNPFYKFAEALVVGVSAAYSMVVAYWTMVIPNLVGKLLPGAVQAAFIPEHDQPVYWPHLGVLILSILLLWRLSPVGGWVARWPLAFIIGTTAGFRLIAHLESDFAIQIQATILPLIVRDDGGFNFWMSVRHLAIMLGVMAGLTYFFFSIEHKGFVGKTARVGIWVLMITFGAGFAYTVMGRITLLTNRIDFLFNDWLWLIN